MQCAALDICQILMVRLVFLAMQQLGAFMGCVPIVPMGRARMQIGLTVIIANMVKRELEACANLVLLELL